MYAAVLVVKNVIRRRSNLTLVFPTLDFAMKTFDKENLSYLVPWSLLGYTSVLVAKTDWVVVGHVKVLEPWLC